MPAHRKHKLWKIRGEEGCIRPVGTGRVKRASMRFGDKEKCLGFAFTDENKALGLKILRAEQERRRLLRAAANFGIGLPDHLKPISTREPERHDKVKEGVTVSLRAMVRRFEEATYKNVSMFVQRLYKRAVSRYVIFDCEWDMLDERQVAEAGARIHRRLIEIHNAANVKASTLEKDYTYMSKIFDYIVGQKALVVNPMRGIPKPVRPADSERGRWLPEELEVILFYMERIEPTAAFSESVRVLMLTGMRAGELLSVTREQASGDYIPVVSKVTAKQGVKDKLREIPVQILPSLRESLDRLLAIEPSHHRTLHLFPNTNLNKLRKCFNAAVAASGIWTNGRTLNCCRKSTIWWLEHDQLWDRQDIIDMIGHSEEIDDLYYRERPRGMELKDRVRRRTGNVRHQEQPMEKAGLITTHEALDLRTGNGPFLDHCRTGTERESKQKRRNLDDFGARSAPWGSTGTLVFCSKSAA